MKKDLSVSIVTYNNDAAGVNKLLNNLLDTKLETAIYVVDNSPDSSLGRGICKNDKITYIFNNKNVGYGSGHNIAIRKTADFSKYHLVINPDISFNQGTLDKIFIFMEKNPEVALIMPKILGEDGATQHLCKLLPNPLNLFARRFLPGNAILDKMNYAYELRFTGYDKTMEVPCLSGCFMFIRSEAFKKVGLFDERFFMYFEDFDLSRRIYRFYKTIFYPEAAVYHKNEKGSYKDAELLKYHMISAIKYFNKWGWFFDRERTDINKATLNKLRLANVYK
jgi:GT2 family glycosyltransferase